MAQWLLWTVVLMALWLLLTGTLDPQELVVGAASSGVGALTAVALVAKRIIRLQIRAAWLLRTPRLVRRVLLDNWTVLELLVRRLLGRADIRGEFRALPFEPGGDDSLSATRRALIASAVSLTPNSYIVGIDQESNLILCHQLVPSKPEAAEKDILGWL